MITVYNKIDFQWIEIQSYRIAQILYTSQSIYFDYFALNMIVF